MIRVHIPPYANDGILRVVEAQLEHLPKFGIKTVADPAEAHIICTHGASLVEHPGVPVVNVNHGLYWSRQPWGDDFMDVNRMVVEAMRHAVAHTAPSEWVSRAIRRGGFWYPEVIYHGIDADKFLPPATHSDYILWNKARADFVSNPEDVMRLANIKRNRTFYTTIGNSTDNLKVIGPQKHAKMKQVVSNANVYLATTRETFGIGTLEALAYGVPVAGWNWGGQHEIIVQGETGYLATPGDYNMLAECVEACIAERDRLSTNAVADIQKRWAWEPRIEQYANIFKRVYNRFYSNSPDVSIIVTAYKLDQYLPQCLDSISRQTFRDFECIVVDDAQLESTKKIVSDHAKRDNRIRYIAPPHNLGLPGARNFGLQNSCGQKIRHVDADDYLADNAIELEAVALDQDRGIDIAYGHIEVVRTDGTRILQNGEPVRSGWPKEKFSWYEQMAHLNQLPSCVMARRDVYERSGGYRGRMNRNEDAEFWCRVTSLGFRAKKVTQAVTYYHRERQDSKGAVEWATKGAEPDWTSWFPWRMGASNFQEAERILRQTGEFPRNIHMVPFGAQGPPPRGLKFWHVHDYTYPVVSVVVTCGPGHEKYLIDALDSIQAQTYPDWECIVINDTGIEWPANIMGAPWAKVVNSGGNRGTSAARNIGFHHSSGRFIVWMDADDYWFPWFLQKMVNYGENNDGIIYSDIIMNEGDGVFKVRHYNDFLSERVPFNMQYPGSSILVPRKIAGTMMAHQNGFSEDVPGMEDWDYQITVHHLGFCAYRIPEPLFIYRLYTSTKRDTDYAKIEDIRKFIDNKYPQYRKGEKKLMCGCNSPKKPPTPVPSSILSSSWNFTSESIQKLANDNDKSAMVMVEYVGPIAETFTINSRMATGVRYRFGNNNTHRSRPVFLGDAEFLMGLIDGKGNSMYRVVGGTNREDADDPVAFLGQPITA